MQIEMKVKGLSRSCDITHQCGKIIFRAENLEILIYLILLYWKKVNVSQWFILYNFLICIDFHWI